MSKKSAALGGTDGGHAVKYVVNKRFKYNDAWLEPGAEFHPGAGKYDAQLVSGQGGYVERIESAVPNTRAARQRVRKEKA